MASQSAGESKREGSGYTLTPPTGTAYERMRSVRPTHFGQPLATHIGAHAWLLGLLALAAGHQWLATLAGAPGDATLAVVPGLGAVGGTMLVGTGVVLIVCGRYRRQNEPLTELEALRVIAVEDLVTYAGLVTGGLTVAIAVAAPLVGVGPVSVAGGPAAGHVVGATAVVAAVGATVCWAASRRFREGVPGESE